MGKHSNSFQSQSQLISLNPIFCSIYIVPLATANICRDTSTDTNTCFRITMPPPEMMRLNFALDYAIFTVKVRVNKQLQQPRLQRGHFPVTPDACWGLSDGWRACFSHCGQIKLFGLIQGNESELEKVRPRCRVSHCRLM